MTTRRTIIDHLDVRVTGIHQHWPNRRVATMLARYEADADRRTSAYQRRCGIIAAIGFTIVVLGVVLVLWKWI